MPWDARRGILRKAERSVARYSLPTAAIGMACSGFMEKRIKKSADGKTANGFCIGLI